MKLQDIFEQLSVSELKNISIGGEDQGKINERNWAVVVPQINLGLNTLYKRFQLKEGRIRLSMVPKQTAYRLTSEFAVSNKHSRQPIKYINDTIAAPFKDDIIKVKGVIGLNDFGFPLNNAHDPFSMSTSSENTLHVPALITNGSVDIPEYMRTDRLDIIYQADHPKIKIPIGYFDPATVEVELPYSYLQALLYFVASRAHNPTGMVNEFNAGNNYAAKFEQECRQLELENLDIDQAGQTNRARRGGWV